VNRRQFAFGLCLIACAVGTAKAQLSAPRRIGVLLGGLSPESAYAQAFRQGLLDANYVEGRDFVIEWRWAVGDYARVPALAAELVRDKVDVIVVTSTQDAQAAKRATSTIPIVMVVVSDPIGTGLVNSLSRPGGNMTGLTIMTPDLTAKRLQLLKEAMPQLTRLTILWNPDTPFHSRVIEEFKTTRTESRS